MADDDDMLSVEDALERRELLHLPSSDAPADMVTISRADAGELIARCDSEGVWYLVVEDLEVELGSVLKQLHRLEEQLNNLRGQNSG